MRASRGRRSASLHIVIPVIVAPHMMLSHGVSPTLVRIGSDAHTAIRRMTTAASHIGRAACLHQLRSLPTISVATYRVLTWTASACQD